MAWFQQIAQNVPGALWVADLDWNFLYVSPGYERIYQRSREEFLANQQSFLSFVHPDDRERLVLGYRQRARGSAFEEEFRVVLPDGSVRWMKNVAFPARAVDGCVVTMTGITTDVTECRQVHEHLRRDEAEFHQLADSLPQIVCATGPDGIVDYYNRQWYEFTGLPAGQVGEEGWAQAIHPEDLARVTTAWSAAVRSGESYEMEFRLRRGADGAYCWFLARARPVRDADGSITRWYASSTDITERKETEAALATTTERLRLALDTTRSGAWDWDIPSGAVLWTPEHNEVYDLPREQSAGSYTQWLAQLHPDDRQRATDAVQTALANRQDVSHEFRVLDAKGGVRWILSSGRALYDAKGQPLRMVGVVRDVTEHKQAEAALRESEQRFRLASLHAPFPNVLFTDDGEILQLNEAWLRLTGYERQELATIQDWLERAYFTSGEAREVREFLAEFPVRIGACVERPGRRLRCKDGTERTWDISVVNLGRLSDGRQLRGASAADVTARHRDELALREAKDEAERANAAKSVFLSRMSHELRTPLNAILGFGQVLQMGSLGEQATQCVDYMVRGGQHLLTLVDEVLDLARVDTGNLKLQLGAVNVNSLVRECLGLTSKLAQDGQVTCSVDAPDARRWLVWADEQRLRQVLLNLLSNAIKYNQSGGRVAVRYERKPNSCRRLSVSDTGPGIAPENLPRLFVPFERLGHEYGGIKGSGLGLAVSKQLVEAMGGRLGVDSQLAVGSTFWLELPSAKAAARPRKTTVRQGVATTSSTATLLYVEDDPASLEVVRTVIERARPQWRFLGARDGPAGLDQARKTLPDLILLDLQLPVMKGDTVLAELRKSSATRKTPVLVLSADATAQDRDRLLALGASHYLTKPFVVDKLLEKLDEMISPPKARANISRRQKVTR